MIEWLKWKIAGNEMLELERWRLGCHDAERWLAEFDDVAEALGNLRKSVSGNETYYDMLGLRDKMRKSRQEKADAAMALILDTIQRNPELRRQLLEQEQS